MTSTRVLCIDDHPLALAGIRARLEAESDLVFAGGFGSAENLVDRVQAAEAQVVLMDVSMSGSDPFEAAKEVATRLPGVRVVFLSAFLRDSYINAAYEAGAWGYLFKGDDLDAVVSGLRQVAAGEFALSPSVLERVSESRGLAEGRVQSRLESLTKTELQILRLIGRGLSRGEIARFVHRSPKTVDSHRENLMRKLGFRDRVQLALFAVREGLVEA